MSNNIPWTTLYNLDEHLPHTWGLDLWYTEVDIAQVFQDCFLFQKLSEVGLPEAMLTDPSSLIEQDLDLLSKVYSTLLTKRKTIELRETHQDLITQSVEIWRNKISHFEQILQDNSENKVLADFFLSRKEYLEQKIADWTKVSVLQEKELEILSVLEDNIPFLQQLNLDFEEKTLPFPLTEKLNSVLEEVSQTTTKITQLWEDSIRKELISVDAYLDSWLVPYADIIQDSKYSMSEGMQAMNELMWWSNGSPAIKTLANQQIALLDSVDDDWLKQWEWLQDAYSALLLNVSSIQNVKGKQYEHLNTVASVLASQVTQWCPAQWLQSECERHLIANYDEAVQLLGEDVPQLSETTQKVSRLLGKLSWKESKKWDLLADLQWLSKKHASLKTMIRQYNDMLAKWSLTMNDLVTLSQFDLLGDFEELTKVNENSLPQKVEEYVTANI